MAGKNGIARFHCLDLADGTSIKVPAHLGAASLLSQSALFQVSSLYSPVKQLAESVNGAKIALYLGGQRPGYYIAQVQRIEFTGRNCLQVILTSMQSQCPKQMGWDELFCTPMDVDHPPLLLSLSNAARLNLLCENCAGELPRYQTKNSLALTPAQVPEDRPAFDTQKKRKRVETDGENKEQENGGDKTVARSLFSTYEDSLLNSFDEQKDKDRGKEGDMKVSKVIGPLFSPPQNSLENVLLEAEKETKAKEVTQLDDQVLLKAAQLLVQQLDACVDPHTGWRLPEDLLRLRKGIAGQIAKIELINFMCHSHLVLEFEPHTNIILGVNGSGKSALLQALQIAMGAKAQETGRATSYAKFVKSGCNRAIVRVTCWNRGVDAYKYENLGPAFTIEKRLLSGGKKSKTSILDCHSKVQFSGVSELQNVLNALGIDVANPIMVMTQDASRTFASSSKEKERFKLYMKAVHFDVIDFNYTQSREHVRAIVENMSALTERVSAVEEEVKVLEAKRESLIKLEVWLRRRDLLDKVLAWAKVAEIESACQGVGKIVQEELPRRRHAVQLILTAQGEKVQNCNVQKEKQQERIAQLTESISKGTEEGIKLKQDLKNARAKLTRSRTGLSKLQEELKDLQGELQDLEDELKAEDDSDEVQNVAKKHASAKCAAEFAEIELNRARASKVGCAEGCQLQEGSLRMVRADLADKEQLHSELRSKICEIEATEGSLVGLFGGRKAVSLRSEADQAYLSRKLRCPALGPLGSVLHIKEEGWAVPAEVGIGRWLLNMWLVDNSHDAEVLRTVSRKYHLNISIVISRYDVAQHEFGSHGVPMPQGVVAQVNYRSLLSLLTVTPTLDEQYHHVILNALIDHAAVERVIVVDSIDDAKRVLRSSTDFMSRYKVNTIVCKDGYRCLKRRCANQIIPSYYNRNQAPCIGVLGKQVELKPLRMQISALNRAIEELRVDVEKSEEALLIAQSASVEADKSLKKADALRLKAVQDMEAAAREKELASVARNDVLEKVGALEEDIGVKNTCIEEQLCTEREAEALVQGLEGLHSRLQNLSRNIPEEIDACGRALVESQRGEKEAQDAITSLTRTLNELERHSREKAELHCELQETLSTLNQMAREVCDKGVVEGAKAQLQEAYCEESGDDFDVESLENTKTLENLSHSAEIYIKSLMAAENITLGESEAALERLRFQMAELNESLIRVKDLRTLLNAAHVVRVQKLQKVKEDVACAVSRRFGRLLRRRGHSGQVLVDYETGHLKLNVAPGLEHATSHMGTLSGGERSIVTLNFILALAGYAICPPFHILDEFDVFMDATNRAHAFGFLLRFSLQNMDRQVLLLTPQDTGAIEKALEEIGKKHTLPKEFLNIQRMPGPRT